MKRFLVVLIMVCMTISGVYAQVRIDLGVDIPLNINAISTEEDTEGINIPFTFPFPSAALYYTFNTDHWTFGLGARAYSLILITAAWPNLLVEYNIGPIALAAQAGGGVFGIFGLINTVETGSVFIPDLSAWLKIGNTFRLGGGAMGFFVPELSDTVLPIVFYIGIKGAIKF